MKIRAIASMFSAALLLAGCGEEAEKDLAYFKANPEEAKAHAEQCMKERLEAFGNLKQSVSNSDETLKRDKECAAAISVTGVDGSVNALIKSLGKKQ